MTDPLDTLALVFLGLGAIFMAIASIGILRMPDFFLRMQAASKASALGAVLMFIGVALHFQSLSVTTRAIVTIVFIFFTVPVAAQLLARTAYVNGVPFTRDTRVFGRSEDPTGDEAEGAPDAVAERRPAAEEET